MNFVVTLNIGNVLHENSRNSMSDAARRWGCSFHEITKQASANICFNKIIGIDDLTKQEKVDGIFYADADILIRNDTPNPFEIFTNHSQIYGVPDVLPSYTPEFIENVFFPEIVAPWFNQCDEMFHLTPNCKDLYSSAPEWFINAGMFLFHPNEFHEEMELFMLSDRKGCFDPKYEQCMWNYIIKCKNRVQLIEHDWNQLSPDTSTGKMKCYIYHFTGFDSYKIRPLLPIYDWTV